MANRVILGKRGGANDFGLFISRDGVNVADTTSTTPLSFNADAANSLIVHSYGQGVLLPSEPANASFTVGGVTYTAQDVDIAHGLGFRPEYAVRWCRHNEISSGVATQVWSPSYNQDLNIEQGDQGDDEEEENQEFERAGGIFCFARSSSPYKINISNEYYDDENTHFQLDSSAVIYYSYVIFNTENTKNGESL